MLELYHGGLTTCSKKVRLCLAEKRLAYRSHYLDLRKFEHHAPEYLRINPKGVVPTLVDDGQPVIESMLINEYLDEKYPEMPLRPQDPLMRDRMRVWTRLADREGLAAVAPFTWPLYKPVLDVMSDREQEIAIDRVPTLERRERWLKVRNDGFTDEDRAAGFSAAECILSHMEEGLQTGPWLMGQHYSLADIDLLPYVDRIAQFFPQLLEPRGCVDAWLARMRARPAVHATYTPSADAPAGVVPVSG